MENQVEITSESLSSATMQPDQDQIELPIDYYDKAFEQLSHELRTSIHWIINYSNFGLKRLKPSYDQKLKHYFNKINMAGKQLSSSLDDLMILIETETNDDKTQKVSAIRNNIDAFTSLLDENDHSDLKEFDHKQTFFS